ncbi:hypothetical protein BT63DRAFT_417860 [Microthyrium microscopicum]|uniref:Uncharacterized protein n=1 Tax=Microthyrium microscopicum TaxID=703497 RepID=A0A6A6TXQ7_9PEZI|nr:hypothetical protein BT63DRAFT_417860 [Microthyrium microscopicum]
MQRALEQCIDQKEYNTYQHSLQAIQNNPNPTHSKLQLSPWLPLIISSRNLASSDIHIIILPSSYCTTLLRASSSAIFTDRIGASDSEDLLDAFPHHTTSNILVSSLFHADKKWFARLDACSLKDAQYTNLSGSEDHGAAPLQTLQQLDHRLTSSRRGSSAIARLLEQQDRDIQYRWHKPFYLTSEAEIAEVGAKVFDGVKKIFADIVEMLKGDGDGDEGEEILLGMGFSFDVVTDKDGGNVRFVELKIFGAMTGCGSCLFQWISDARILYGVKDFLEFRVAVASRG